MTPRSKNMTAGCIESTVRTVGAIAARSLMDFAMSRGCALAELVERSGIDPAELRDSENRIPYANYVALMRAAKELCDDPAFALHFGESDEGAEASMACMAGIFSPTVREGLSLDGLSSDSLQMTRDGQQIRITVASDDDFPERTESSFARAVCTARRVFPGTDFMKAIHFKHAEPPYRAEYDRIFRMPVFFGSESNALLTDAAWLEQLSPEPPRRVFEIVKARADTLRQRVEGANSTRGRVEALLTSLLHDADVSIDVVAGKLGMGRHTLFRKLRAEGVTFKQVLDELRRKLAIEYLSERNFAVNETAYLLGFSDPTAFSRAYKRWTGHSPGRPRA